MNKETDQTEIKILIFAAGLVIGVAIMLAVVKNYIQDNLTEYPPFQTLTIKAGHAEYYLDENNERKWRWKTLKP